MSAIEAFTTDDPRVIGQREHDRGTVRALQSERIAIGFLDCAAQARGFRRLSASNRARRRDPCTGEHDLDCSDHIVPPNRSDGAHCSRDSPKEIPNYLATVVIFWIARKPEWEVRVTSPLERLRKAAQHMPMTTTFAAMRSIRSRLSGAGWFDFGSI